MKEKGNIKGFRGRKGFTLIELLVVVLIIGLLAAVALPQYQKAVKKAQVVEVLTAIDTLDKGLTAYYLEHDNYGTNEHPADAANLGIDMPVLKYFKYSTTSSYEFQIGSPAFPYGSTTSDLYAIYFRYDLGPVNISSFWTKGKLISKKCTSNSNISGNVSCADFFPQCPPPKNVGTGSPNWQSECNL